MRLVPPRLQMEYNLLAPYTSSRVRTVRLVRSVGSPMSGSAVFGFSIRGGREHGTGFFVSEVGSDARSAGLRVGDQIVRINGYSVEQAIHQEVLKLIQDSNHLNLKVRSVGMIPVKDHRCDPLTWKMVAAEEESITPPSPSTTPTVDSLDQPELRNMPSDGGIDAHRDIIQYLNIIGRSKLDCCICKGPGWRPGIFIQSTKEGGFAREAGLRPGDQIVECNGINFEDISFSDAVNALKKDKNLNLVIRKGSGTDLFPGESSGYNSSASSINGDGSTSGHSPNGVCQGWNDDGTKRLSIVREEVSDMSTAASMLGNTISQSSEGRVAIDKSKDWDEIEYEWEVADKQLSSTKNANKEHRALLTHPYDAGELVIGEEDSMNDVSVEVKTQEVVAMVHRTEEDETDRGVWSKRDSIGGECQMQVQETPSHSADNHTSLMKTNSSSSAGSALTSVSLSSALTQEIQRRAKRMGNSENGCNDGTMKRTSQMKDEQNGVKKDLLKEIANDKRMQHSKLMEEFKKAHSKMFANSLASGSDGDHNKDSASEIEQRNVENGKQRIILERNENNSISRDFKSGTDGASESCAPDNAVAETGNQPEPCVTPATPPPPPPMPSSEHAAENGETKRERLNSAPSLPHMTQKQTSYSRVHSSESSSPRSPKTPFFSYENNIQIIKSEKPAQVSQKQPQVQQPKAPVSVTISEYPSSSVRRAQPTRFDFLPAGKTPGKKIVESSKDLKQPKDWNNVNSQLQSELLQTLSRSKLKAQTEAPPDDKRQSSKTFIVGHDENNRFSKENGDAGVDSVSGRQNGVVSRYFTQVYGPEKPSTDALQPRSPSGITFQNTEKILNAISNKVTIRIPNNSANAVNKHP
ncbi:uncharacterized protein [Hetaerina americana]|uniref:uncharacterized protein n=1 Tax=Hetaerina americana TaxID=62018 RepID=UPI003A7F49B4